MGEREVKKRIGVWNGTLGRVAESVVLLRDR